MALLFGAVLAYLAFGSSSPDVSVLNVQSYSLAGGNRTEVVISSEVHYENITAYATLAAEAPKDRIRLYRTTNGEREEAEIDSFTDANSNSLIDRISWTVPSLSEQKYEIVVNAEAIPAQAASLFTYKPNEEQTLAVIEQTGIDQYLSWQFTQLNSTAWKADFSFTEPMLSDLRQCLDAPLNASCWQGFRSAYAPDSTWNELRTQLTDISNYPRQNLTAGVSFSNFTVNRTTGTGSFIINVENLTEGSIARLGWNSTIIGTSEATTNGLGLLMQHPIVQTGDAAYHLFVQNGTKGGLRWLMSTTYGLNWTDMGQVSSNASRYADARVRNDSNEFYIVYADAATGARNGMNVSYRQFLKAGNAWQASDMQAEQTIANGTNYTYAALELDGNRTWVAYRLFNGTQYYTEVVYSDGFSAAPAWTLSKSFTANATTSNSNSKPTFARWTGSNLSDSRIALFEFWYVSSGVQANLLYWRNDTAQLTEWTAGEVAGSIINIADNRVALGTTDDNVFYFAHFNTRWNRRNGTGWLNYGTIQGGTAKFGSPTYANGMLYWFAIETVNGDNITVYNITGLYSSWSARTWLMGNGTTISALKTPAYAKDAIAYVWASNFTNSQGYYDVWSDAIDVAPPRHSGNSTNITGSTTTGDDVLHSLKWNDYNLSTYIFSYDNGTGIWTNDTPAAFTSQFEAWSNATKAINSTVNATKRWQVFANDSAGRINASEIFNYIISSSTPSPHAPPNATPFITNTNATQIPNASIARASDQLFFASNFTSQNGTTEANSTFKWLKRTLYQPQNRSLVGYWKLDGNANDSVAGNDFDFNGTARANGSADCKIDDCVYFDRNGYLNRTVANYRSADGSGTIEAWIRTKSSTSERIFISSDVATDNDYLGLMVNETGYVAFQTATTGGDGVDNLVSGTGTLVADGNWHHVAVTSTGSAYALYVDGVQQTIVVEASNNDGDWFEDVPNRDNIAIGAMIRATGNPNNPFNGSIDEVAIYNYAKSAAEIYNDYRNSTYSALIYKDAVAYWHLDENGGGLNYSDSSGNGNNGVPSNVTNISGMIRGAVTLDGIDDYINGSNSSVFDINGSLTLAAWVKPTESDNGVFVSKYDHGSPPRRKYLLGLYSGKASIYVSADGSNVADRVSITNLQNNTWYHIAGVYDSSAQTLLMYVNGVREDGTLSGAAVPSSLLSSTVDVVIGRALYNGDVSTPYNGSIDEVAIYNRSLTASEVKQLYLRSGYDYSPQVFLNHFNNSDFNTTDNEKPLRALNVVEVGDAFGDAFGGGNFSNGYLNFSSVNNLNYHEGTVEFWVRPYWTNADGLPHYFFDTSASDALSIKKDERNDLTVNFSNVFLKFPVSFNSGSYYHVAFSWSNHTSNFSLYVNGTRVNNSAAAFAIPAQANLIIGASSLNTSFSNASFSEFRISRKALTAQEVNESFSKGRQFFQNEYLLNSSNYRKGDIFKVEYAPTDSQALNGTIVNSSYLTITNFVPSQPAVTDFGRLTNGLGSVAVANHTASSVKPANASFISALNITWNAAADNDTSDTIIYRVLMNGTYICQTSALSCNVSLVEGFHLFNVTAFDGTDNSTATSYAFNFDNTTPAITIVPYTAPNSTFQNVTHSFLNFSVTETNVDRFSVNLTGLQFSSFNGRNTTVWDKDLVGQWHFEDGNGSTTANDSSGSGYHGNLSNMNFTGNATSGWTSAGRLGAGLIFDVNNDYVNLGNATGLDFTTEDFSVFLWVKVNAFNAEQGPTYFSRGLWQVDGWYFQSDTQGDLYFTSARAGAADLISGDTNLNTGIWNHVGFVRSGSTVTFYANGTSYAASGPIQNPVGNAARQAAIGAYGSAFNTYLMNGTIDEVKVWRRALAAGEVSAEYNRTASNYLTSHSSSGNVHTFSLNMTNLTTNGNYSWFAWVNDSASNVAHTQATPRFLTIDTAAPAISFVANTPANNSYLPTNYILINTTSNDAGNDHNDYSAFVDFNNSLVGYWRFEDAGDTNASDFTSYNNNGTLSGFGCTAADCNLTGAPGGGGTASGFVSSGKRGKAMAFDGVDDYVNAGNSDSLALTAVTIEAWVFPNTANLQAYVLSRNNDAATEWSYGIYWDGVANKIEINQAGTPTSKSSSAVFTDFQTWVHAVITMDSSGNIAFYRNGVAAGTETGTLTAYSGHRVFVSGRPPTGAGPFNGSIDEVKIWNRALSAQEINASFNAGIYRLQNNYTGLTDGNYSYKAFAVDAAGSINSTENRTFMVDTVSPGIAYGLVTELHNANLSRKWLFVNVTVAEAYVKNVSIELWNSTHLVNRTNFTNSQTVLDGSNLTFSINFTAFAPLDAGSVGNLTDGVYRFNATIYDLSENRVTLGWRTATVDTTVPMVDYGLNSDANNSFKNVNWVFLNFSYTELNNDTFMIRNGSTNWTNVNATLVGGTTGYFFYNFTSLNDGNFTAFGWVNDSAGNVNQTLNRTVLIDTTMPGITYGLVTELHNANLSRKWLFVNVTVSETYLKNLTIELWNSSGTGTGLGLVNRTNFTNSQGVVNGGNVTFQINFTNLPLQGVGLPDDVYYFNATVYDLSENRVTLGWRTATVDTTPPKIDFGLNTLANGSAITSSWVLMNFTYTELNNDTFMIRNLSTNWTNVNVTASGSSGYFFYNFTGLNEQTYSFFGWINDTTGNVNQTLNRTFTVDSVAPVITPVPYSLANSSFINVTYALINVSTTESSDHSAFVDFNNSLVGYWRFEDDGDTNASDFTSYNNNGTLYGFGCTAADCNLTGGASGVASGFVSSGKRGKAMAFDGVGDVINITDSASMDITDGLTIEAWVKSEHNGGDVGRGILAKTDFAERHGPYTLFINGVTNRFGVNLNGGAVEVLDTTSPTLGVWYHVAATYDRQNLRLYVNGVEKNSAAYTASISADNNNTAIGWYAGGVRFWNGSIDEVKIWNRALNETEINASFSAGTYRLLRNFTGLSDGNYTWNAHAVDSSGTLVSTGLRNFTVDTFAPVLSFDATANGGNAFLKSVFVNVTANDTGSSHNDYSAHVDVNRSLVGWWRLEEGSGTSANDFSSYGNAGTLTSFGCTLLDCNLTGGSGKTGSGWTSAGRRGKALRFDGEDDFVTLGNGQIFNMSANFTVEAWVYPIYCLSGGRSVVVGKGRNFIIYCDETPTRWMAALYDDTLTYQNTVFGTVNLSAWQHVAFTFSVGDGGIRAYYNGEASGSSTSGVRAQTDTFNFEIGRDPNYVYTNPFNGSIDEVKIWNRALSAQEIAASFSAGKYRLYATYGGSVLPDGNHTLNTSVYDAAGSVNATSRSFVIDNTAPVISAMRLFSNATGSFWVGGNSSTAATVYFNSIAGTTDGLGGGGAQWVTVEVAYTDLYRNSLDGNSTFGDRLTNDSKIHPQKITYSIETGLGNASALISANDTANNTDAAVVSFVLDINDTTTSDNSSGDERYWYSGNVTINLSASDAHSGVNRTYYCTYNAGSYPCIPKAGEFTFANVNIGHVIQVNCSGAGGCQQAVRYYSMDNVSNNESGGANGGSVRESTRIQINTGTGSVTDTIANGTSILGSAVVTGSNITNSTIDSCRVTNTWLVRSTVIYNASLPTNCSVSSSTIFDTNVTSSTIMNSYIDPSFVYDSYVTNSNLTNAIVYYSRIENSTTCAPDFSIFSAVIRNDTLVSGTIAFNGTNYYSPFALSSICANVESSPIGTLAVNKTAFRNNDSILFTYSAPQVGRSVMINTSELFRLDNTSTSSIYFNDNGTYPDSIADDAVYRANYTIGSSNNISDGSYLIFANASDNLGNKWRVPVNVTLDNARPNATIVIGNGSSQSTSYIVSLRYVINDSGSGVEACSFANEDRLFVPFEPCSAGTNLKAWALSPTNGTKAVIIQVRDAAGSVNETNDTIYLSTGEPTVILTPLSGNVISGLKSVDVAAPSGAVNLSFQIMNASRASDVWDMDGVYGGITFDVSPADGFSPVWRTTNFSNETGFNLTVISYSTDGSEISRDAEGGIQVDNLPPAPSVLFPSGGAVSGVVTVAANSSNDNVRAVFEYSNDGANWVTLGTDFTNSGGWNITFDSRLFSDAAAGRIRVNATDDAGFTVSATGANFEIDNTPPSITITAPTSGSTVSGVVNITYTIIGTVHGVQISFDGGAYSDATYVTYHLWDTTAYVDGSHIFRVRANDSLNNTGYSDTRLSVVDNGGANVIILSPGSGGYKSGNVTISVTAPGTTYNVTFNVSNSSGYFNLSGTQNSVSVDNTSAAWEGIWYTTSFAEDSVYGIEVRAYDASNTLLGTDSITGIEVDNQIPVNATNLTIRDSPVDTDGVLSLVWNASTSADMDHYNVHRSQTWNFSAGTGTFVKSVTTATTTDSISTEGVWFYKVIAVDNVGRESNASNEVNVTIDLLGPTGTLSINDSYVRNNDTIRFTFTGSQTGLTAVINATELQGLDALMVEDFESNWTNSSIGVAVALNSTAQQGSFSNLINFSAGSEGQNLTFDLGAGNELNLSQYSMLTLWVRANDTGNFLNFSLGEQGYHELMNFTINATNANLWEHKVFPLTWIVNRSNSTDAIRYLMFNITASGSVSIYLDGLEAANTVTLRDDGIGDDATAGDAVYTAQYNITRRNSVSDGLKTVRAFVDDGANFLSPSASTTLDNTPPFSNISIDSGAAYATSTTVVLSLSYSDAYGVAECRYSNSLPITSSFEACQSLKTWSLTASSGAKTVFFEAKDRAGNLNTSNDTITLDLDVPAINVTSPVWGTRVSGVVNISFIGVESATPKYSVDGGNRSFTTATTYHLLNTTNLTEGEHTIVIRDEDAAGNVGESSPLLIIVDNIPALLTIISPAPGSLLTGNVTVRAVATEDLRNVSFFLENSTHSHPVFNDTDFSDGWNFTLDTSRFADANGYRINATGQYEVGGAVQQGIVTGLEIDNTAPSVVLVTPADSATYSGTILLNATAPSDTVKVFFEYSPNSGASWVAIGTDFSNISGWNADWDTREVVDGTYIVKATATDMAGLSANDTNAAVFTISNPGGISIIAPAPSVRFMSGDYVVEAVSVDGTQFVIFNISNSTGNYTVSGTRGVTNDTNSADGWRQTVQTANFADGDYNITVYAYDTAGALIDSDNRSMEFDNLAPSSPLLTALPEFDIDGVVVLNWTDVGGDVSYYNLYRSATAGFNVSAGTLVKNLSATSATDAPGVNARYYYRVTAVDNVAHESVSSNEVNTSVQVAGREAVILAGVLGVNDSFVRDGDSLMFTFSGSSARLNVTINSTELARIDNSTTTNLQLNDSGLNWDAVSDDAVYTAVYNVNLLNNATDGAYIITGVVNDSANNRFYPRLNITVDNTAPNISIQIFGTGISGFTNVSTEYAVSRAVTLITSFNDTIGIDKCRYANENQAYTPWESCIADRAWLLSEGAGNKTVIIDVRDIAGNVNSANDSIFFNATGAGLDVTPPLTPTVIDDGTYTNTDVALHAAWNSTDQESELLHVPLEYEYRIRYNGTSDSSIAGFINESFTYASTAREVTVHRMNLTDGNNYTFEVRAVNTAGVRSAIGSSDGIIVDVSPPAIPSVNSTHIEGNWSQSSEVRFNWTATDSISNVSAYSYVLDRNSSTVPDSVPESESEHSVLATPFNDGQGSVLKFNSSGNASTVYLEVRQNLSVGDVLRVTVQLAESHFETPDRMAVRVYATSLIPAGFNMTANNISEIVDFERNVDYKSDLRDATSYAADVQVNTAAAAGRFFVAIAGSTADNDNNYNLLIAKSNMSYDSSRQSYYCMQTVSCVNTTNTTGYAVTVAQRDLRSDGIWDRGYSNVGDGTFYFHVRAQDKAGNFGPSRHYQALVDRSAPSIPQMILPLQRTSNISQLTFNWTDSTDPESGVGNYSLAVDNNSDFSSPEFYGWVGNVTNYTVTGLTADTAYYAHVHSRNVAGVNSSWSDSISLAVDTTSPVITLSKPTGTVVTGGITVVLRTNEKAVCSAAEGIGSYATFTFTNSTLHETRVALSSGNGDKTLNVKCADAVSRETALGWTVTVDSTAAVSSVSLQSPSVFTEELVDTNVSVRASSGAGLGEISRDAFSLRIGGNAVPFSVFDTGGGNYTLSFRAPSTNGSYTYDATVSGVAASQSTLKVSNLLFVVQYLDASISGNKATRMVYSVEGNFSIGMASDSRSVTTTSAAGGINLSANARDGDVFVFVTRSSGNVERAGDLLRERKFLEAVNPSFGYQLDQETFIVFTDLEYGNIALSGNKTLKAGKYNLVVENKGFDSSLNKTRLEVRIT